MGDVNSTINSSFHGAEDTGSGGGASQTNIQGVKFEFFQQSSGEKETSGVSSGIVSQPDLDAVEREFMAVSSANNPVSFNTGERYLATDILVGESDNHAVFGSVEFVVGLNNQAASGIVIGFTFTAPAEFNLETLEVSLVLDNFNETHVVASIHQ